MPSAAWVLFAGTFLNRFGSFVVPFLVLYLTKRGFTTQQAGLALGAYGVGNLVASLVGGGLTDRIGRRETIVLSMVSSAAAMIALSRATTLPFIIALATLAGATAELYRPASSALIADLVPPDLRVTAYSLYRLAINLGFAAGPASAGFVAAHSFVYLFIGDAATSILFGLTAWFALPRYIRSTSSQSSWGKAFREAARQRAFLYFLLGAVMITIVDFQMNSTLPLHMLDHGFGTSTYGWLISINGVIIIFTELAITRWTRHWNRRFAIALGWFLIAEGFALTGVATTIPMLIFTVVLWTVGEMICSPLTSTLVADTAPVELRGRFMGLFNLSWSMGMVLGPPLGTMIYGRSPKWVWIGCAMLGVIGAALVLVGRESEKSEAVVAEVA